MKKPSLNIIACMALLFAGNLYAQQPATVTTIIITGDNLAREKAEKKTSHGLIHYEEPEAPQDEKKQITSFGDNSSYSTATHKKVEDEIIRITREKLEKANYTVTIIQPEKKENALGISGGVINIDGLPHENAKKAAKTGKYEHVVAIESKVLYSLAKDPYMKVDGANYNMKDYYLLAMSIKISFYDKEGKPIETKKGMGEGERPMLRSLVDYKDIDEIIIDPNHNAEKARKKAEEANTEYLENGEGVPEAMILQLYENALDKALGL